MPTFGISLPDLEAFMASKSRKLRFPPDLEAAFQKQTLNYRKSVMRHIALPTALVYNAFLVADYLLVPDTLLLATILHLAVVTPYIFLASFLYGLNLKTSVREVIAAVVPALIVGQIMLIYSLNSGPLAAHYQYLAVLIVVFMNVNQRLGYRFAVATTIALAAMYVAVLLPGPAPLAAKFIGASSMAAVCYLTLLGNLRMERELRHSFLMRLRDRLYREGAEDAANRDPLTGISNRRHLDDSAARIWAQPDAAVSPIAMIMVDIDHFKAFNDCYGHPAGDTCLKRIAGVISAELRDEDDIAARFGGEEFLVVLPRTGEELAVRIAERIRRSIEGLAIPHRDGGPSRIVTASFGVVVGNVSDRDVPTLIGEADEALYQAKGRGRNRVWPPLIAEAGDRAAAHPGDKRQVA